MFGIGRLIVGTSGSPGSMHALRYGEVLARAHDAALIPTISRPMPNMVQPALFLDWGWQLICSHLLPREARSRQSP